MSKLRRFKRQQQRRPQSDTAFHLVDEGKWFIAAMVDAGMPLANLHAAPMVAAVWCSILLFGGDRPDVQPSDADYSTWWWLKAHRTKVRAVWTRAIQRSGSRA